MTVITDTAKRVTLHYENPEGSFSFSNIEPAATDQQIFNLAHIFNAAQADPVVKISVTHTQLIV